MCGRFCPRRTVSDPGVARLSGACGGAHFAQNDASVSAGVTENYQAHIPLLFKMSEALLCFTLCGARPRSFKAYDQSSKPLLDLFSQ